MYEFEVEAPTVTLDEHGNYLVRIEAAGNLDAAFHLTLTPEDMADFMPALLNDWHGVQAVYRTNRKEEK